MTCLNAKFAAGSTATQALQSALPVIVTFARIAYTAPVMVIAGATFASVQVTVVVAASKPKTA